MINQSQSLLYLIQPCSETVQWAIGRLNQGGLQVLQTFDFEGARGIDTSCTCAYHGTERCDCQMAVLLVYGKYPDPATLVIHGQDGKTWISMATPVETGSRQNLESSVRHTLIHRYTDSLPPVEPSYGTQPTG